MDLKSYTLFKEDIERVREAGGPLASISDLSNVRDNMAVTVVEVDGQIVAYWCVFYALHAEPLWVREDHRKSPAVISAIVEAMTAQALQTGEPAVFSIVEDDLVAAYGKRLGFQHQPGQVYYLMLQPVPEPVER